MFSYYGKLCTEVYELTKPVGCSIDGDLEYYKSRLKDVQGKILEAAVGSGRIIIPLLEEGFEVEGIDYSNEMLKVCRERCEERNLDVRLFEANLKDFTLPNQYEAIIIPTGSFCLIEKREDAMNALQRIYEHLQIGGRFIVDLEIPYDWKTDEITTSTFELPNGDGITMERKSIDMDWLNQVTTSYLKYEKWREGTLIDSELQKFSLRWYGIEEFRLLLEKIGFTNISCSANYEYNKQPTDITQSITFEATKKL